MSRWFRLYDEVLDDPKVQRLSGDEFKAWVNILCLASRNDGALPPIDDIAFALRLDAKKASAILSKLVIAGLVDETDDRFVPHAWNDRQYKSDVSTDRVKRFRKRKKTVAGNDDETFHATPPDTDTDTEVPLSNDNGAKPADPDVEFWVSAKGYLAKAGIKNPGSLVGKWIRDHGKVDTADALTRAQLERAVEPIPFVEGCFRRSRAPAGAPIC